MLREILNYPDPRLRKVAKIVTEFDEPLETLSRDMFETMYHSSGIGLAATQIDIHLRVVVVDVSRDRTSPLCLVNPVIEEKSGTVESKEGCLSVPETVEYIERAEHITFRAQNVNGENISMDAEGLLAICIQHEIDHLDGKLFVDYLSNLKQNRLKKRISKIELKESTAS
tara:strand:+ start:256 stop:765 length:510 start_codon:yes stop_codon:yes gene_type:complete